MKHMTLAAIEKCTGGTYIGEKILKSQEITGVEKDSRLITTGNLYLPFVGQRVDGYDFIDEVFQRGALAVLSERDLNHPKGPYIKVDSVAQALKDIAEFYRKTLHCKIIGITGSVGKTSTKEVIASVLQEKFHILKTEGNYNNEIGMPLTILKIRETDEIAVIEMGISDFGEMHRLSKVARPDVCVITNIGACHLENLKSIAGVFRAKTEMFDYAPKECLIVLNGDDKHLREITNVHGNKPVFFGIDTHKDVTAVQYHTKGLLGTDVTVRYFDELFNTFLPVPGYHMIYNAMAAVCIGKYFGMTFSEIDRGIRNLKAIGGRNHIVQNGDITVIDDCYNANPISMKASLKVLGSVQGRTVAILGDMLELGEDENKLHYEVGSVAAREKIDQIICIGHLAKHIAQGAIDGNARVVYFETKENFENKLFHYIQKGDTVLVKASNGMKFQTIVEKLVKA